MIRYNTQRGKLNIKEYGRHIQQLVDHIKTLPEKEERNRYAKTIIELMGMLFPHLKNVEDFRHKLWDHLFVMADFDLDVDSPYPIPTSETIVKKPNRLTYPKHQIKFRHYGKNVEILIDKALVETDVERQRDFAQGIATVMKMTYRNWNRDGVVDDTIKEDLRFMSNGVLELREDAGIDNMPLRNNPQGNPQGNPRRNNNRPNDRRNSGSSGNNNRNNNTGERRSNNNRNPNDRRNSGNGNTGNGNASGTPGNNRRFNPNNRNNNNRNNNPL